MLLTLAVVNVAIATPRFPLHMMRRFGIHTSREQGRIEWASDWTLGLLVPDPAKFLLSSFVVRLPRLFRFLLIRRPLRRELLLVNTGSMFT